MADNNREIELRNRLWKHLEEFSEENHISVFETIALIQKDFTFTPDMVKGGIGLIVPDVYAVTDADDGNVLIKEGKKVTVGQKGAVSVVLLQGKDIVYQSELELNITDDGVVPLKTIVFTNNFIFVLDWDKKIGRYFKR